jgi:hypothetical protein
VQGDTFAVEGDRPALVIFDISRQLLEGDRCSLIIPGRPFCAYRPDQKWTMWLSVMSLGRRQERIGSAGRNGFRLPRGEK